MAASTPDHSFALIMVAAGKGERFQSNCPKQFQDLKPPFSILEYSLQAFLPVWSSFVRHYLVVQEEHKSYWYPLVAGTQYPGLQVIQGGSERYQSVFNALHECFNHAEYVIIHDAVRPLTSTTLIKRVMHSTLENKACIPALPVRDTVKEVYACGRVKSTLDRDRLRLIQTPQGFHLETLYEAMQKHKNCYCSDEAGFLEIENQPVTTIEGEYSNIKITYPEDMEWARYHVNK